MSDDDGRRTGSLSEQAAGTCTLGMRIGSPGLITQNQTLTSSGRVVRFSLMVQKNGFSVLQSERRTSCMLLRLREEKNAHVFLLPDH